MNKNNKKPSRPEIFNKLPYYVKFAYESYARTDKDILAKIKSEQERVEEWSQVILRKRFEMEHPQSQYLHAKEMVRSWTCALSDLKRLKDGIGDKEELEAYERFFMNNKKKRK